MVAGWATEPDMSAGVAQHRLEILWDSAGKDAADLQEQIADTEGASAEASMDARRALATLNALVAALAAVHARFSAIFSAHSVAELGRIAAITR